MGIASPHPCLLRRWDCGANPTYLRGVRSSWPDFVRTIRSSLRSLRNCGTGLAEQRPVTLLLHSALRVPTRLPTIAEQIVGGSFCSVVARLHFLPSPHSSARSTEMFGSQLPSGCFALQGALPPGPPGQSGALSGSLLNLYGNISSDRPSAFVLARSPASWLTLLGNPGSPNPSWMSQRPKGLWPTCWPRPLAYAVRRIRRRPNPYTFAFGSGVGCWGVRGRSPCPSRGAPWRRHRRCRGTVLALCRGRVGAPLLRRRSSYQFPNCLA